MELWVVAVLAAVIWCLAAVPVALLLGAVLRRTDETSSTPPRILEPRTVPARPGVRSGRSAGG